MKFAEKFYCNREPNNEEVIIIKNLLKKIDLKEFLEDNFVYVLMHENGKFELLSFENDYVYIASAELKVNNKMAIEYLIEQVEIEQMVNKILYDNRIGSFKKFRPVEKEKITRKGIKKIYSNFNVYSPTITEATRTLTSISFFDYIYLEDVSKKKKTNN